MHLSMKGIGVALALTLMIVFVLCALVQLIFPNIPATHNWVNLFTAAPAGSARAWFEGVLYSGIFGLVAGHIFAWAYNKTATH